MGQKSSSAWSMLAALCGGIVALGVALCLVVLVGYLALSGAVAGMGWLNDQSKGWVATAERYADPDRQPVKDWVAEKRLAARNTCISTGYCFKFECRNMRLDEKYCKRPDPPLHSFRHETEDLSD